MNPLEEPLYDSVTGPLYMESFTESFTGTCEGKKVSKAPILIPILQVYWEENLHMFL